MTILAPEIITVTLCGSVTNARRELELVHRKLALLGILVHAPVPPLPNEHVPPTQSQLKALKARHFAAIDLSNPIVIVAPGKIIGDSTAEEFDYAFSQGKDIRLIFDEEDLNKFISELTTVLNGKV